MSVDVVVFIKSSLRNMALHKYRGGSTKLKRSADQVMERRGARRLGRRLVLFPLPLQGHINPMFQLATLLFRRGFSITVVHTRFNSPDPSTYPDFRFAPVDVGLAEELASSEDILMKTVALIAGCREPFRQSMARMLEEAAAAEGEEPVSWLVTDFYLYSFWLLLYSVMCRQLAVHFAILHDTKSGGNVTNTPRPPSLFPSRCSRRGESKRHTETVASSSDLVMERRGARRLGRRLVLFPLPFQGHINPMFQLATLLFRRGFAITVVHTRFNAPDPSTYPDFRFASIEDGLGDELASSEDAVAKTVALNAGCREPFRQCVARMLEEAAAEGEEPVAWLVADFFLYSLEAVAEELGLRRVVLRTGSAACVNLFMVFPTLREKGYYPIQEAQREAEVPEAPPYRVKDLIRFDTSKEESFLELLTGAMDGLRAAAALVLNTFEGLEAADLAVLRRDIRIPVFPVGPLHKFSLNASNSLLKEDRSCMEWLDGHPPGSVIYVSFGSLACMNREEFLEVAWGLAGSRQPFLWVVRPGSVRGEERVELPAEFAEETRGRGVVVAWAPQSEVLAHPAVGGFWTHCGWNSIMESLCEGVPMLCRPSFGDQPGNARYVSHVWKVGLVLDQGVLQRGEVERAVRRLMVEEEEEEGGVEMRERAKEMKQKAGSCIKVGGSSYTSLDNLVDLILS